MIHGISERHLVSALWEAERLEFIVRSQGLYGFTHDRVQEAAYSLIPASERAEAHLRIGRLLKAHTLPQKLEEAVFEIVSQYNQGASLITSREEREEVAELNLLAGKRAKTSTAYASALKYFVSGATLLGEDAWERNHELAFALEFHRAECEFLTNRAAAAEERLRMLLLSRRAVNTVELAAVTCLRVDLYMTLNRSERAVDIGLDYLRYLGVDWSPHPTEEEVRREYNRIWTNMGNRTTEQLIDLPLMSDPAWLGTMDVLTKLVPVAGHTDARLNSLVVCRMVNLTLEHGSSDGSVFAYVSVALLAAPNLGNYTDGFRFGQLGYELIEKRGLKRFQARTYTIFASHVMPWDALHQAQAEIARVSQMTTMEQLAASIAHEVNQPLAAVVTSGDACLHWLAATPPNLGKARRAVERMVRDGNRASDVLKRVRALLRKAPLVKSPVNVNKVIQEALALVVGELRKQGVEFSTESDLNLPPVIADFVQLQQVLLNLVMNAIESMAANTNRSKELHIQSRLDDNAQRSAVLVAVSDSGVGLTATEMEQVFEAFYSTKPEGMGMGLWICRSIIEAHGGQLTAWANDAGGATFQFVLPSSTEAGA
jgi:signal transduction histidine kinase